VAGENRAENNRVILYQSLASEPYKYDFFQALRLVECANADKSRIGNSQRPSDDPLRLAQEPSLAFAPSTVSDFEVSDPGMPPRMSVLFFGLFGPNGPLPLHLTEYARERIRNHGDEAFAAFTDIFHHRFLSLFYRAWADAQPTTNFDRPQDDRFAARLSCLIGDGYELGENRDELDFVKLNYAARFLNQTRNAEGLLAILSAYYSMPVELEQYVGQWLRIPDRFQWRLGADPESGSLGLNSTLGERVWQCQSKFRLIIGPLTLDDYQRLLPGRKSLGSLVKLVRHYVGDELDWELKLILKGEEVKPASLGEYCQLGWTSWLPSDYPLDQFDELSLNPIQEVI